MDVVVAAWAGSTNIGDELALAGLVRKLVSRDVRITVTSTNPPATEAVHGVRAIDHRNLPRLWEAIGEASALVLGGGGLVQDKTSAFNLPYHLSRPWIAGVRGRPWAGIGLGVGPLETRAGRALARRVVRSAEAFSVRDEHSASLLRGVGITDVTVGADLAIGLDVPDVDAQDRLVACLRPWHPVPGRLPVALSGGRAATPAWFVDLAAQALDEAAAATGLEVRLVALQADRDGPLHDQIAARMTQPVTSVAPSVGRVVDEIAGGRVVVAMRYHAGIAAALGGRPTVLVGYTPKVDALVQDLGGGRFAGARTDAGATLVGYDPIGMRQIPAAVLAVADNGDTVAAARDGLRQRERNNDRALDRLLHLTPTI